MLLGLGSCNNVSYWSKATTRTELFRGVKLMGYLEKHRSGYVLKRRRRHSSPRNRLLNIHGDLSGLHQLINDRRVPLFM